MAHPLQLRLSDAQVAALDAAATLTDPFTGLQHTLSRQQVLLSILDAWMVQHVTSAPERTTPSAIREGESAVREETVQAIADSAGLPELAAEALTPETPPVPADVPVGVSTLLDEPGPFVGDVAPVRAPSRAPTTKKAKAKAKTKKRPTSADLDRQVLSKVGELGPCSCAAVQKALAMANSTVYGALQRLVEAGTLVQNGERYVVVPALQDA